MKCDGETEAARRMERWPFRVRATRKCPVCETGLTSGGNGGFSGEDGQRVSPSENRKRCETRWGQGSVGK